MIGVIKTFGWIFFAVPLAAFIGAGVKIIGGLAAEDGFIKMIVSSLFAIFALGSIILILVYLTDVLQMFV